MCVLSLTDTTATTAAAATAQGSANKSARFGIFYASSKDWRAGHSQNRALESIEERTQGSDSYQQGAEEAEIFSILCEGEGSA